MITVVIGIFKCKSNKFLRGRRGYMDWAVTYCKLHENNYLTFSNLTSRCSVDERKCVFFYKFSRRNNQSMISCGKSMSK